MIEELIGTAKANPKTVTVGIPPARARAEPSPPAISR